MSFFLEISEYKNTIIGRILENQELCKALFYQSPDFLEQPDIEDTTELIYKCIFPHRFIPDINMETGTYIALALGDYRLVNNSFKTGIVSVNVFTHRDTFKTDYQCTRVDFIANKIDEMLNYKDGIGLGKLEFKALNEYVVNEKFQGYAITYKPVDFNR